MKKLKKALCAALCAALILSTAALTPASAASVRLMIPKLSNTKKGIQINMKKIKGVKKYIIRRKLSNAKKYKVIKTVRLHTFIDKKVKAGKKYVYSIEAVKKNGASAAQSGPRAITRLKAPKVKASLKKDVYEYYGTTELGGTYSPALSWNKVKGAKKYEIFRQTITGKSKSEFKKYDSTKKTKYEDYGTDSGSYYSYMVRAVNGKSKGAFSSATAKKGYMEATYTTVTLNKECDGVTVDWEGSTGARGYKVYKSTDKGKTFTLLKNTTATTIEDKDVKIDGVYFYYVLAYNSDFISKKSETNVAKIRFKDYVYAVQVGEEKVDPMLSKLYNQYMLLGKMTNTDYHMEFTSDDESIAKVEIRENDDNTYSVVFKGIKEGCTYISRKVTGESLSESVLSASNNPKAKIKVSAEPVYDIRLKAGETDEFYEADGLNYYYGDFLKTTVTSSDESVVKVNNDSGTFTITGMSAGEATISLKAVMDLETVKTEVANYEFKILVE